MVFVENSVENVENIANFPLKQQFLIVENLFFLKSP